MNIELAPITGTEADHLLLLSDAYMASLYPPESNHLVSSESLRTGDAVFIGALLRPVVDAQITDAAEEVSTFTVAERCVACVAARFYREEGYAEIKRLYVEEAFRGNGLEIGRAHV